ncbi:MAG: ABC transporter substrate-binding protein [Candidatus Hodarchaeota archaeon]
MIEKRIKLIWKVLLLSLMLLSMIGLIDLISISSDNRVNTVTIDTSDLLWYYQNLDSNDRQKIRQAMDYAIPRDQILTDIFNGYSMKIASPIAPNMLGYDPTVQARDKDINTALNLLKDVFGYQYDGTNPYFSMTLTVPDTNQNRVDWANFVNQSFKTIGIDVELVTIDWNTFSSRHWIDPVGIGYDYSHGGHDGLFIGFWASKNSNWSLLTSSPFPPDDYNVAYIENSEVDAIWDKALTSINHTDRIQALEDFQSWWNDNVPISAIPNQKRFFAVNSTLEGLDTYLEHNFQNFTIGAQTSLSYAIHEGLLNLNPLFASSTSDIVVRDNLHGCLMRRRGAHNITHPVGFLADSWTTSSDGRVWTINLRQGVQWHDDTEVTASDVVFTYHAVMEDSLGSPLTDFFVNVFNGDKNNIKKISTHTVEFTFPAFFPFAETEVFSLPILKKTQMESIPYSNWKTHGTNTGTIILNGFGPYKFASNSSGVVTIAKSNSYNDLRMGHDPSAIGGGIWWPNATLTLVDITVENDPNSAVDGLLLSGIYDAIHPDIYDRTTSEVFFNYATNVDGSSKGKLITGVHWAFQGLFYNQYSPIWGMNPGDPRDMYLEYDTTPPILNIDSPTAKTYTTETITVDLSGDAEEYWYYIAGVDSVNQTWSGSTSRTLADGSYTLHAYGEDTAGNIAHKSVTFEIDTTEPTTTTTTEKNDGITPGWDFILLLVSLTTILSLKHYRKK